MLCKELLKVFPKDIHYLYCKKDVSMIFRGPMEQGLKHEMATPDSEIMLKNLDDFMKKWKDAELKDWHIINGNVMDALDRIRVHISEGCLTGIPPGCGTNRNENLHKTINPFFSRCGIGIPLVLALLTILFHRHNKRLLDAQQLPVLHARALKSTHLPNEERFGVIHKDGKKTGWIFEPILKSAPDVSMLSVVEPNFPPSVEEHVTISDIYALLFKANYHTSSY